MLGMVPVDLREVRTLNPDVTSCALGETSGGRWAAVRVGLATLTCLAYPRDLPVLRLPACLRLRVRGHDVAAVGVGFHVGGTAKQQA